MKKILTIALVALLAASTAFAGLSGKATLSLGYDTKTGAYGFSNGKAFSLDLDVASLTAENAQEGDIVAGAKASLVLKAADRYGKIGSIYGDNATVGLGLLFTLDEAYIKGQDWKVAITGTQKGPDFATSAIDFVFDDFAYDSFGNQDVDPDSAEYVAKSYSVSVNKAPGVTVSYKDWKVALGFNGGKANETKNTPKFFNYHASIFTPSLELADGFTVKAAAVASGIKNKTGVTYTYDEWGNAKASGDVYAPAKNFDAFGASLEGAYASETFSGKLAVDFGMKKTKEKDAKFTPGLDVAANAVVSGFTVDAYYQYGKDAQWISAQVKGDFNTFNLPLVITVKGEDVLKGQKLSAEVSATLDAITLGVGGSFKFSTNGYGVSGSVAYVAEMFTAKAGLNFSKTVDVKDQQLYANASVESSTLVPGATLKLAYAPKTTASDNKQYKITTTNFLDSEADKGAVTASCTIKF